MGVVLISGIVIAWQFLATLNNSTGPTVAGRPLSNPHTHLHTVALGGRPGVLYLGTHYGLFTSTDGGRTWPQPQGILNQDMVTAIAVSPSNPNVLALLVIPTSIGAPSGVAFSSNGGVNWQVRVPAGLSLSAYPYTLQAGSGGSSQFYVFYHNAGWFETRDLGMHWYPITSRALSAMQTPSLLTDPAAPDHLFLGGDQGLFESDDDGHHWNHLPSVQGSVLSLAASSTSPRLIFCATDQGVYRWREGSTPGAQTTRIIPLPRATPLTHLATDPAGRLLYGLSGQNLWFSVDSGTTWQRRWLFDRGDLVSLLVDPLHPQHLYAGFFLPAAILESTDAGHSWHILTD